MRLIKWLGLLAGILLIGSCFMLWAALPARNIVISGIAAEGTSFGKPGYFHLVFGGLFIIFHLIPTLWAKRINLVIVAFNLAWAVRNYFVITACRAGECPEKHTGIYLILITSVIMLVAALFPDMKLPQQASSTVPSNKESTTP